ncbi:MAG: NAD-dependent epimerase/dehydratase family protein [Chloroflexota bacterium]|nr:NAD-dependent epimerase/dehydratase family protein [Chloroflexota bacterium]
MQILVIGGARHVGDLVSSALSNTGHTLTYLNRSEDRSHSPASMQQEHAQLEAALAAQSFDAVIDTSLPNVDEAEDTVRQLQGRIGHYIYLSSGQVYLVRQGIERPFREQDYEGMLMPEPKSNTYADVEWQYGMELRRTEDVFMRAWREQGFPMTALRLPMMHSERDQYNRLYHYILRLRDGGPILVPTTPNYLLRHVYVGDVVQAILRVLDSGLGKGKAFNISQDESVSLDEFLEIVGGLLDVKPQIVRVARDVLEANGFLPDCSPFSERWMSALDNRLSKAELGMMYTPLELYLKRIVEYYTTHDMPTPAGYKRRRAELRLLETPEPTE